MNYEKETTASAADPAAASRTSYDSCVQGALTTNILAALLLVLGIVCTLWLSALVGCILCLAAELVVLIPNSKWQKAFRKSNDISDKTEYKKLARQCRKDLKARHPAYRFSFVLAVVSLVFLILSALLIPYQSSESAEDANAKSILQSTWVSNKSQPTRVTIEKIHLIKTQKAYNRNYSYYIVKTESKDWGYAEFRDGEVVSFSVGYSWWETIVRCRDCAKYRLSMLGSYGQ